MAGIPVRAVPGVGGGIEIMREFKLGQALFSRRRSLPRCLQGLSSLSGMAARRRADQCAGEGQKHRSGGAGCAKIELHADQLHVDLSPWMGKREPSAAAGNDSGSNCRRIACFPLNT